MKKFFSRFRQVFSRKMLVAAMAIGIAAMLPISSLSAANVRFEMSMGAANVTAGHTTYKEKVTAKYDEVVKVQVYYHNMEDENSGKIANDIRLKLDVPTTPGKNQVVRGTISSPDINTVQDTVTIELDRDDAYLEYIPGSAIWKHNKGTNENVQDVEEKISDEVVYGGQGVILEDAKPCWNFDATVTILMRVRVPGISIQKMVRVKGTTEWKTQNTAKPNDVLEYQIVYKNMGNTTHKNVVVRDNLPPNMTYVPGTTYLANATNPQGVKYNSDNIALGGIVIGNYSPGANAFVKFEVKLPENGKVECGEHRFRNVGVVRPEGMNEYYNTATTTVNYPCAVVTENPVCESLTLAKLDGRKVRATLKYAPKKATFKTATFNFGDGSTPFTTNVAKDNTVVAEHTYSKDGEYTVNTTVRFTLEGKEVVVTDEKCTAKISFTIPGQTTPKPTALPNTGPGEVAGMFAAVSVAGAIAHKFVWGRRFN